MDAHAVPAVAGRIIELLTPIEILEVPAHSDLHPQLKSVARHLADSLANFSRIDDGVPVVAKAIVHSGNEAEMGHPFRPQLIHQRTDRFD